MLPLRIKLVSVIVYVVIAFFYRKKTQAGETRAAFSALGRVRRGPLPLFLSLTLSAIPVI
jgi:hypothetical protein